MEPKPPSDPSDICIRCGRASAARWRPAQASGIAVTLCAVCLVEAADIPSEAFALWAAVSGEEKLEVGDSDEEQLN